MKYVVPDMAQSFGTLEFAGESDHVFDRDKDNRRFFARRRYNLYSDVQRGENVVVEIPVPVSYTHLDVYKRQHKNSAVCHCMQYSAVFYAK